MGKDTDIDAGARLGTEEYSCHAGRLKNGPSHLNEIIYRYPPSQIQLPSTLDMGTTVPIAMPMFVTCNKFCHHVYVLCGSSDALLIEVRNDTSF